MCDRLSEQLILKDPKSKVKTNGSADTESRRNKYEMGEQVRHAGLRVMMQKKATTWSEIENYMNVWQPSPYNVIVKPMEVSERSERALRKTSIRATSHY